MPAVITGTGMSVPPAIVTNDDLTHLMDTTSDWIETRTGVRERRLAAPGVATSTLGTEAASAAMADADIAAADVDALVVATMTPDFYAPGSAPLIHAGLGLNAVAAYDIRQQCSGFLYAMELGDTLIAADRADTVVVVGAEVHAGIQPWADDWRRLKAGEPASEERRRHNDQYRTWSVLFGDGAGAMVLRRSDIQGRGLLAARLYTDGTLFELIHVPAMGSASQPWIDVATVEAGGHMPSMQGPLLYRNAVRLMPAAVNQVLDDTGLEVSEVDLVIAHQANLRIVEGARKRLGLDSDAVPINLDRYGNTTAGTLPILFHEMREAGRVPSGTTVAFTAFGAGAHWGAALYREP